MIRIIIFMIFIGCNTAQANDGMPQERYSFFVSVARFIMFPIRYFTAPCFRLNDIPTQDHLEKIARIKELTKKNKEAAFGITSSTEQIPWDQGNNVLREMAKKNKRLMKITAQVNVENLRVAQQHDQLTLVEQVFTDRKKELHKHLWVTTSELYKVTNNRE